MSSRIRRMRRALVAQQNRDDFGCWIPGKKPSAAAMEMGASSSSSVHKKGKAAAMEKGKGKAAAMEEDTAAMEKAMKEKRTTAALQKALKAQGKAAAARKKALMNFWELHNAVAASQLKIRAIEEELAKEMGRKKGTAEAQVKIAQL
ncbi:unnamed protein product [Urochloa humidicola]